MSKLLFGAAAICALAVAAIPTIRGSQTTAVGLSGFLIGDRIEPCDEGSRQNAPALPQISSHFGVTRLFAPPFYPPFVASVSMRRETPP